MPGTSTPQDLTLMHSAVPGRLIRRHQDISRRLRTARGGTFNAEGRPVMPGQAGKVTIVTLVSPATTVYPVPDEWFNPVGAAEPRHVEWRQAR